MAQVISADVEALRAGIAGQVFLPEDPGYDEARTVWNADIDRHPAVIVRCANASDVSAAIGFARNRNLEIAVRGGAHSTPGNSVDAPIDCQVAWTARAAAGVVAGRSRYTSRTRKRLRQRIASRLLRPSAVRLCT